MLNEDEFGKAMIDSLGTTDFTSESRSGNITKVGNNIVLDVGQLDNGDWTVVIYWNNEDEVDEFYLSKEETIREKELSSLGYWLSKVSSYDDCFERLDIWLDRIERGCYTAI